MKKLSILFICAFILIFTACGHSPVKDKLTTSDNYDIKPLAGKALDYSSSENWMCFEDDPDQKVDLFYIYPTINYESSDDSGLAPITEEHKNAAKKEAYDTQGSAFASYTNVYAPYYRQVCLDKILEISAGKDNLLSLKDMDRDSLPRTDIYAALDYYFNNINNGRPFIFAGHSQGSFMISIVLEEYMKVHPEYLERMVAAYAIGAPFDKSYIERNPHLKYAEGETDTGCIITWNTQGPGATIPSRIVAAKDPYCINPLNWKTDDTYASESENLGSIVDGEIVKGYADAQIDTSRGVLICNDCTDYSPELLHVLFGDRSLHGNDWELYYENIKENGKKRIEAYFANQSN